MPQAWELGEGVRFPILEVPGGSVTESGVQLLTAQKPIKWQGWWKGKFALFQRLATWAGEGRLLSKGQLPRRQSVGKREGAECRNSTVSSDSHLGIGHAVV